MFFNKSASLISENSFILSPPIINGTPAIAPTIVIQQIIPTTNARIPDIFNNTLSIKYNNANTSKKAITSYNNIFIIDTPLKIPLKLKNGKCLYRNVATGFFK